MSLNLRESNPGLQETRFWDRSHSQADTHLGKQNPGHRGTSDSADSDSCTADAAEYVARRLHEFSVVVPRNRRLSEAVKRITDVILSATLLFLLSPLFAFVALCVKWSSSGPVFYSQERVGLGNRRFRMLKFRSMRVADTIEMQSEGVINKISNHPRLTRIGRIIRKTSIDELPQLLNVFRGEMSLVGPRPLVAEMALALETKDEQFRARMRPGLTGLWQIRDRFNSSSALSMIPHDREYIERFSLWLDFKILALTIPAVLTCRGAM